MSRNPIWDYFTKSETDASKAKCPECTKLLFIAAVTYNNTLLCRMLLLELLSFVFIFGRKYVAVFVFVSAENDISFLARFRFRSLK